jgi:esterase/lipase
MWPSCDLGEIEAKGEAQVSLAGRPFTIKKQFIDDIAAHPIETLAGLKRDLLVCHSPLDSIVSINEAEKIFIAAKHPKRFISLDKADHLLSNRKDAEYVANLIATWAGRFSDDPVEESHAPVSAGEVRVTEKTGNLREE